MEKGASHIHKPDADWRKITEKSAKKMRKSENNARETQNKRP